MAGGKNLVLAALVFAVAMTFIDQTIVAIAIPSLQRNLSISGGRAVDHQRLPAGARWCDGSDVSRFDPLHPRRQVQVAEAAETEALPGYMHAAEAPEA